MRVRPLVLLALALCSASPAFAWPVDVYFDLEQGEDRLHRLSTVEWVEVKDPELVTAELTQNSELLLSPKKPGRTLLLLYAEGKFAVWRLRVSPAGVHVARDLPDTEGPLAAAKKACPKLSAEHLAQGPDEATLVAAVKDDACRKALLPLLSTDAFRSRQLELTYEMPVLQAQLKAMQAAVDAIAPGKVELRYVGAGLVAKGSVSAEQKRRILWALFDALRRLGRVRGSARGPVRGEARRSRSPQPRSASENTRASENGFGGSSCSQVQSVGALSGRNRSSFAACRKRGPCR